MRRRILVAHPATASPTNTSAVRPASRRRSTAAAVARRPKCSSPTALVCRSAMPIRSHPQSATPAPTALPARSEPRRGSVVSRTKRPPMAFVVLRDGTRRERPAIVPRCGAPRRTRDAVPAVRCRARHLRATPCASSPASTIRRLPTTSRRRPAPSPTGAVFGVTYGVRLVRATILACYRRRGLKLGPTTDVSVATSAAQRTAFLLLRSTRSAPFLVQICCAGVQHCIDGRGIGPRRTYCRGVELFFEAAASTLSAVVAGSAPVAFAVVVAAVDADKSRNQEEVGSPTISRPDPLADVATAHGDPKAAKMSALGPRSTYKNR